MEEIIRAFFLTVRVRATACARNNVRLVPVLLSLMFVLLTFSPLKARESLTATSAPEFVPALSSPPTVSRGTAGDLANPVQATAGDVGLSRADHAFALIGDYQVHLSRYLPTPFEGESSENLEALPFAVEALGARSETTALHFVQYTGAEADDGFSTFLPSVHSSSFRSHAIAANSAPIPMGSHWKYLDDGSSPPPTWTEIEFDDSGWKEGEAKLGYGDQDVVTEVSFGADENSKHITSYFRHAFSVEDPMAYTMLDVQLRRDDGAVVYLNGHEIFRSNMPDGPVTSDTLALSGVSTEVAEQRVYQHAVAASLLVEGRNVMAAEVHQRSSGSSDLAFDLALLATGRDALRFAAIGDYGVGMGQVDGRYPELDVANLVKSWSPDLIITLGDNNYLNGLWEETWGGRTEDIDDRIGRFYGEFISPYSGKYTGGNGQNRFFPSLGNHDWNCAYLSDPGLNCGSLPQPHLDYFSLPGNERYYDFAEGPVHFFVLDSDERFKNDLVQQRAWLDKRLPQAIEPWKVVYFHHPPYNLGGSRPDRVDMRWEYRQLGASAVLTGHDHLYNRQVVAGIPYFVNGLGGMSRYECAKDPHGEQVSPHCFNDDYGAMLVVADDCVIRFDFISRAEELIDSYSLSRCR